MDGTTGVTSSWEFLFGKAPMVCTAGSTYTCIVAKFTILIESIYVIDVWIICSAVSVIFVISMVTIVTSRSCCTRRCICVELFLLCFLYICFLIFLLGGAFGGVLATVVVWVLFREAAVLSYSLKVAWLNQAWDRRNVAATSRWSCRLPTVENPASSDRRQRAVASFFNSQRSMCWRSYLRWIILTASTIAFSIGIDHQRCSSVQIDCLILCMILHLWLSICLRLLWWESS